MTRAQAAALALLAVPVVWGLLWWGWRGRVRRTDLGSPLPAVPDAPGPVLLGPVEGTYVSTTSAGDWLDRVAAHRLGVRAAAEVVVHTLGVTVDRQGEPPVWIPAADVVGARRERGMAGKFTDAQGVVVVTWRLGEHELDTGVRTRYADDRQPLVEAVRGLAATATVTKETEDD